MTPDIDPTKTHEVQSFKHGSPLIACRFDPSGRFLFTSGQDSTIIRWEIESDAQTTLKGHESWVRAIGFVGEIMITADYAGVIRWWPVDAEQPEPSRVVDGHDGWIRAVAISPDQKTLATCGNDRQIKLWSIANGEPIRAWVGHDHHIYNLAFHPEGERLVTCDLHGIVRDWSVETGEQVRELEAKALHKYDTNFRADIGGARGIAMSEDGKSFALCGITNVSNAFAGVGNPSVHLFDWESGELKQHLKTKESFRGTAWGVTIHSSGLIYASGGGTGGAAWWWKPTEEASFHTLKLPQPARDMATHPDGVRFAVAGSDGIARIYSMTAKS